MVMLRPMASSDLAVCVEIFEQAFTEMRTCFCLPVANGTEQDARHQEQRFDGFLRTDPAGSWVAVDLTGFSDLPRRSSATTPSGCCPCWQCAHATSQREWGRRSWPRRLSAGTIPATQHGLNPMSFMWT